MNGTFWVSSILMVAVVHFNRAIAAPAAASTKESSKAYSHDVLLLRKIRETIDQLRTPESKVLTRLVRASRASAELGGDRDTPEHKRRNVDHTHGAGRDKHAHNVISNVADDVSQVEKQRARTQAELRRQLPAGGKQDSIFERNSIHAGKKKPVDDSFPLSPDADQPGQVFSSQEISDPARFDTGQEKSMVDISPSSVDYEVYTRRSSNATLSNRVDRRLPSDSIRDGLFRSSLEHVLKQKEEEKVSRVRNATEETLYVEIDGNDHEVNIIWTYPSQSSHDVNAVPGYTGFKVTYKTSDGDGDTHDDYESPMLEPEVRSYMLHSLHDNKKYSICVHVMVNNTSMQHRCGAWSQSTFRVITGILAGAVFLIPCIIALGWILHKDKQMKMKAHHRSLSSFHAAQKESLIKSENHEKLFHQNTQLQEEKFHQPCNSDSGHENTDEEFRSSSSISSTPSSDDRDRHLSKGSNYRQFGRLGSDPFIDCNGCRKCASFPSLYDPCSSSDNCEPCCGSLPSRPCILDQVPLRGPLLESTIDTTATPKQLPAEEHHQQNSQPQENYNISIIKTRL